MQKQLLNNKKLSENRDSLRLDEFWASAFTDGSIVANKLQNSKKNRESQFRNFSIYFALLL